MDRENIKINDGSAALYESKAAALKARNSAPRREGAIKRTVRLFKELKAAKAQADSNEHCSAEDRRELYSNAFHNAWAPVMDARDNAADTLWSFLYRLWYDFVGIAESFINFVIKIFYYLGSVLLFIWDRLWDLGIWLESRKNTLFQIFAALIATIVLALITVNSLSGYEYSYYGRTLGIAKTKQEVHDTIELLGDKLSESSGVNVNLDVERDIEFKRVFGLHLDIDNHDDILNTLTYMKDVRISAYAINVDGRELVILDNEDAAKAIIEEIKNDASPEIPGLVYESVEFGEEVKVEEVSATLGALWRPQDALNYLKTGSIRPLADDEEATPFINVYTSGTLTWTEEVGYGTSYVSDDTLYIDQMVQTQSGKPGVNRLVASVSSVNGVEVDRQQVSKEVLSQPTDAVYHRGTKAIPARSGTGTWIIPVKGAYTITSPFGWRGGFGVSWADFHSGTDFYQPYGSRIYASDGGVVIYAGWRGAYGYCVDISHGGNYVSRYAHCSRLLVSVGQNVAQGECIALIGATGFVTGAHLHFEVLYNGKAFDPMTLFR